MNRINDKRYDRVFYVNVKTKSAYFFNDLSILSSYQLTEMAKPKFHSRKMQGLYYVHIYICYISYSGHVLIISFFYKLGCIVIMFQFSRRRI